jgi:hypothetical protein
LSGKLIDGTWAGIPTTAKTAVQTEPGVRLVGLGGKQVAVRRQCIALRSDTLRAAVQARLRPQDGALRNALPLLRYGFGFTLAIARG